MTTNIVLHNSVDSINLNSIEQSGYGYEAGAGITGLGLVPVQSHWTEGIGHGSRYRGQRFQSRDIDIPIQIYAATEADLRTYMHRLSVMCLDEFTMTVTSDGGEWYLPVRRVGGGDYSYGTDTDGKQIAKTVLTVRGGPFFNRSHDQLVQYLGATGDFNEAYYVTNPGSAPIYPVIRVWGRAKDFTIYGSGSAGLRWLGILETDESLIFDFANRTVKDDSGNNRYGQLAAGPDFFALDPGVNDLVVEAGSAPANSVTRTNHSPNPYAKNDTHNWVSSSGAVITRETGYSVSSTRPHGTQIAVSGPQTGRGLYTVTGLTPGKQYFVQVRGEVRPNTAGQIAEAYVNDMVIARRDPLGVPVGTQSPTRAWAFVANEIGQYTLSFRQAYGICEVHQIHVMTDSGTVFTGDTPDVTDTVYAWSGTAHASPSTATTSAPTFTPSFAVEFLPRDTFII